MLSKLHEKNVQNSSLKHTVIIFLPQSQHEIKPCHSLSHIDDGTTWKMTPPSRLIWHLSLVTLWMDPFTALLIRGFNLDTCVGLFMFVMLNLWLTKCQFHSVYIYWCVESLRQAAETFDALNSLQKFGDSCWQHSLPQLLAKKTLSLFILTFGYFVLDWNFDITRK